MKSISAIRRLFPVVLSAIILLVSFDFKVSAEETVTRTIKSIDAPSKTEYTFDVGTSESEIISKFPTSLNAEVEVCTYGPITTDADGAISSPATYETVNESIEIMWSCDNYNSEEPGEYTFKMSISSAKSYINSASMQLYIYVTLVNTIEVPVEVEKPLPVNEPQEPIDEPNTGTGDSDSNGGSSTTPVEPETTATDNNTSDSNTGSSSDDSASAGSSNNSSDSTSSSVSSSSSNASTSSSASASTTVTATNTTTSSSSNSSASSAKSESSSSDAVSNVTTVNAEVTPEAGEPVDNKEESVEDIPVTLTNKTETKSEITVGKGKAVINLEKGKSSDISASITDDETLLRNILTDEQLKRVAAGATVNLKISTNIVSDADLSKEDADKINGDLEEYKKDIPGLNIAGYVDISIYLQIDDDDWSYVSNTNKPVELVINVPDSMKGLSSSYYIMRLHDGNTTLFTDNDDDPDTVTISTGKFSIYVIMYDSEAAAEIEKTEKNEMNLLIIFVIILVVVLLVQIVYIFAIRKKLHSVEQ